MGVYLQVLAAGASDCQDTGAAACHVHSPSPAMRCNECSAGCSHSLLDAMLCSYAVAGYTEHMDERGEVKEPPPFDKVAMDWGEIGARHWFFASLVFHFTGCSLQRADLG